MPADNPRRLYANSVCDQKCWRIWFAAIVYGRDQATGARGLTYVEAVKNGWFYTAPIPQGRRILAFHTDADLHDKRVGVIEWLWGSAGLASLLANVRFVPDGETFITSACSAMLDPAVGDGWLAVGDAAMSFRSTIVSGTIQRALYRTGCGRGSG